MENKIYTKELQEQEEKLKEILENNREEYIKNAKIEEQMRKQNAELFLNVKLYSTLLESY